MKFRERSVQGNHFSNGKQKDIKIYFRISVGNWKQGFYSLRNSFSNSSLRNQTALSNWFRRLKDSSCTSLVRWNFIKRSTIS